MMLRETKVLALALFHTFLLAVCDEVGNHTCVPSSCGEIRNISYPLRLQTDPSGCGEPDYELVCQNNRTMVDLLNGGYYAVADINYDRSTIRVVDPGIERGNCFSFPLHPLTYHTSNVAYDKMSKEPTSTIVLMNCDRQISDANYLPISPCKSSNLASSSQPYVFAVVGEGDMPLADLKYSCTIRSTTVAKKLLKSGNLSMSDLQESLLLGLDFSFSSFRCKGKCGREGESCYADPYKNTVRCISGYVSRSTAYWIMLRGAFDAHSLSIKDLIDRWRSYYEFDRAVFLGWIISLTALFFIGRAVLGMLCLFLYLIYKFQRRHLSLDNELEEFLRNQKSLQPIKYSFSDLKRMTDNFKNKLGQGGFGSVYKGKLRSGRIVAVKMLVMSKSNGQDFINEVATVGRIHHINVVRLVGFCVQRSKWALVYDFMPNGSLDKFVFPKHHNNISLSWERLYKIALGVGRGIEYLHQGCDMQILHFDIKPHNILLDEDFTPKVSDFGLAKLYSTDQSVVSVTAARGTLGYIAPELFYKNIGDISFKADVYSFGMLLMEIVGRRKHMNAFVEHSSQTYFPSWIYDKYVQGKDMETRGATEDEKMYIKKMVIVALWCIQMKPVDRPSMSKAMEMLEGDVELLKIPPRPTMYFEEMCAEKHERIMALLPSSSSNSIGTITLSGR